MGWFDVILISTTQPTCPSRQKSAFQMLMKTEAHLNLNDDPCREQGSFLPVCKLRVVAPNPVGTLVSYRQDQTSKCKEKSYLGSQLDSSAGDSDPTITGVFPCL